MAGGLAALLDDIAALAKLAAASVDDVGAAAGRASAKAAGVVIDDTAVTPALRPRASPPTASCRSSGGSPSARCATSCCSSSRPRCCSASSCRGCSRRSSWSAARTSRYEGAEKIWELVSGHAKEHTTDPGRRRRARTPRRRWSRRDPHRLHPVGRDHGDRAQRGRRRAVRVPRDHPGRRRARRSPSLVYGVVALIVKMDDIGLHLARARATARSAAIGRGAGRARCRRCSRCCRPSASSRCCGSAGTSCWSASTSSAGTRPTTLVHHLEEAVHDVPGRRRLPRLAGQHPRLGAGRARRRRRRRRRSCT